MLYVFRTQKWGSPFAGGWMEWPAGLVEKMGYADTIYNVLSAYRKDGNAPYEEDSIEMHIIKTWIASVRKSAKERKHGK